MIDAKEYTKDGSRFTLSGVITSKEIMELNAELYKQWDFLSYKYQLWIFNRVEDFLLSSDEIRLLATQDKNTSREKTEIKVAFVSESPLVFGLCRMYEAFYGNGPWMHMVFKSLKDAEKWIHS